MQVMVNKEDLEAANAAVKTLQKEIYEYFELVKELRDTLEAQRLEVQRLRARLSEFEVQS